MANKRFDLISGIFIKKMHTFMVGNKDLYDFANWSLHGVLKLAIENIYDFLSGTHNDTLEYAACAIMYLIDAETDFSLPEEIAYPSTFSYNALSALAQTCDEGAKKYGAHNWMKGLPVNSSLLNHTLRHLFLYSAGDRSDPHLPHALWGVMASIHMFHTRPDMCTELYNVS